MTKPFESFLAPQLEAYIIYRLHLGYTAKGLRTILLSFDRYVKERKADRQSLQPAFFLELRAHFSSEPRTANVILSRVRNFFQFLVRQGFCENNPLQDIPRQPERAFIPFVFSPEQVNQLLSAVCKRLRQNKRYYLKDLSTYVAIVLMARCGMRLSEPLRLKCRHYRPEEGTVYIEKTKFRKDRLIPVPQNALAELENYLAVRKALIGDNPNPYLLIGEDQKGLSTGKIYRFFHPAVKDIGLEHPRQIIGDVTFGPPRTHSLRHSFAINTLKGIKDKGQCAQYALPVLAAYMGHRKYQYTGAYLKVRDASHRQGLIDFARSQWDKI